MPGARKLGWLPDDDPIYQNAEWTIYIGALPAVKPKPVEPEPRADLWDTEESEQKFFKEMQERRRLRQADQQED